VPSCSRGMRRLALPWLALACAQAGWCAPSAQGGLVVSAFVMPAAQLQVLGNAQVLQVTATDVARGYVDAASAVELQVSSNSRSGFALEVLPLSPIFTAVSFTGFDTPVSLGADGGTVVQRWQGVQSRSLSLNLRFSLPADLPPGLYAWPLQFAAQPL
jgi:hypothetical protein